MNDDGVAVADVGNDEGRILWMGSITKVDTKKLLNEIIPKEVS